MYLLLKTIGFIDVKVPLRPIFARVDLLYI